MKFQPGQSLKGVHSPITFGRIVRRLQVGDSVVIETVHPAGMVISQHQHSTASLDFTFDGSYTEMRGRRKVSCDTSTVAIKPAGESHSNHYGSVDTRGVMVAIGPLAAAHIQEFSTLRTHAGNQSYDSTPVARYHPDNVCSLVSKKGDSCCFVARKTALSECKRIDRL